jgi:hypothetical protein
MDRWAIAMALRRERTYGVVNHGEFAKGLFDLRVIGVFNMAAGQAKTSNSSKSRSAA